MYQFAGNKEHTTQVASVRRFSQVFDKALNKPFNQLMKAIPFDKQAHKEQFTAWCKSHQMAIDEATMMEYLPDEGGFIVEDFGCVFVYQTHTRMAYVDMMMTNPTKPFGERREAARLLIDAIMQFARDKNIHLYSWCTDNKAINHYARYAGSFKLSNNQFEQWYWVNKEFKP